MRKNKKKRLQLKQSWGKLKTDYFNFDLIEEYYLGKQSNPTPYSLSDRVVNDLELLDFFKYADRTTSAIGQQYLFYKIRNLNSQQATLDQLETDIQYYTVDEEKRIDVQEILKELATKKDYFFPFLIFGGLPSKIKYLWLIKGLQFLIVLLFVGVFFYPLLFIPLIIIFTINIILHYWHKNRIGNFAHIFSRLSSFANTAQQLVNISNKSTIEKDILFENRKAVKKISSKIFILRTSVLQDGELTSMIWYLFELFKIVTLSEITIFHTLVDEIKKTRKELESLFEFIGSIDMAISIASFRTDLPYYSLPRFMPSQKVIKVTELYHPLIENCVTNNFSLDKKSLLLTGSNMSGKSTFIRTLNLNAIASQTLNTSFTKESSSPFFALSTSIQIEDDLKNDKSYYMEEVTTIGHLIQQSQQSDIQYLFTIDEVFKGTNTIERISAAKAILEYLNKNNHLIFVSTHDIELTQLLKEGFDFYYFQEQVENQELHFDYKLKKGALKKRNAIKILEIANYPVTILNEAKLLSIELEKEKTGQNNT